MHPKTCLNYVNGEWTASESGQTEASINPANTEEIVGYIQKSTRADLEKAVAAAKQAQDAWRKRSGNVRGDFLLKAAAILEGRADEIAETMTREMGKTFDALPFALISDPDETLCQLFGVIKMKNMYGKQVRGIERSTFLIDADGVLQKEWRGLRVPGHVEAVLQAVRQS